MKKSIIFMMAAVGLLTACDPSKDDISMPSSSLSEQQLSDGFSFKQYDETYTQEKADGNNFTFFTSPSRVVRIYQKDADGVENVLVSGVANGKFKIVPKRGNPNDQTFYVETMNFDGSKVVITKECNVFVPSELSPEMRILASDAYGHKVWTWDTEIPAHADYPGAVWGNVGYAAGESWTSGCWWGATPEGLLEQLKHSNTGVATGEENAGAYMEFYDDGNIKTYDAGGNQIRSGKYSVEGWTGERNHASIDGSQPNWSYGTLKTTEGAILFPFQINGNGFMPTEFEIMQLDANHLQLIYAAPGTGGWGEATWWAFKSESDAECSLTDFGTKAWTWDTEIPAHADYPGAVWGNVGYAAGDSWTSGCWWGSTPEGLLEQLKHSDTGVASGEEDANAYMTFDWKTGDVKSYDGSGKEIRGGKFEIQNWQMGKRTQPSIDGSQQVWAYGTLHTDAGSILFPFQINGGGTKPTDFEIMKLDADHLQLIYAAPGTGGWSEATWWAFKKK